jgi:hypothetical protein
MPKLNKSKRPLSIGQIPEFKLSASEAKLHKTSILAKNAREIEEDMIREKSDRLRRARLMAAKEKQA